MDNPHRTTPGGYEHNERVKKKLEGLGPTGKFKYYFSSCQLGLPAATMPLAWMLLRNGALWVAHSAGDGHDDAVGSR